MAFTWLKQYLHTDDNVQTLKRFYTYSNYLIKYIILISLKIINFACKVEVLEKLKKTTISCTRFNKHTTMYLKTSLFLLVTFFSGGMLRC